MSRIADRSLHMLSFLTSFPKWSYQLMLPPAMLSTYYFWKNYYDVFLCDFNLHFMMTHGTGHLFISLMVILMYSCEGPIRALACFKNRVVFFLFVESFIYCMYEPFVRCFYCKYLLQYHCFFTLLLIVVKQQVFIMMSIGLSHFFIHCRCFSYPV